MSEKLHKYSYILLGVTSRTSCHMTPICLRLYCKRPPPPFERWRRSAAEQRWRRGATSLASCGHCVSAGNMPTLEFRSCGETLTHEF